MQPLAHGQAPPSFLRWRAIAANMEGGDVDAAAMAVVQADLVAWGVLEPGSPPKLTRRAQAAMMRAAGQLREEEIAGRPRPGNPMMLAAGIVLEAAAPELACTPRHVRFLAAVELASLPDGVRGMFG